MRLRNLSKKDTSPEMSYVSTKQELNEFIVQMAQDRHI